MSGKQTKFTQENFDLSDMIYKVRHDFQLGRYIEKPKIRMRTQYSRRYQQHSINQHKIKYFQQNYKRPQSVAPFRTQYNSSFKPTSNQKKYSCKKDETDHFKIDSPFMGLTTYGSSFIGHHGANQYVKVKNQGTKNMIKFNAKTTYQINFHEQKPIQKFQNTYPKSNTPRSSSNTEKKISKRTAVSSYNLQFSKKDKISSNPEEKNHDYSSLLIFCAPTKEKIHMKTSYQTQFYNEDRANQIKAGKQKRNIKLKKGDFKTYQIKEINQLKRRLKTVLN